MIEIMVNGQPKSVDAELTAVELIESVGLSPKAVIVEFNGIVLKPAELKNKRLAAGDRIELIQIVGGG